MPGLTKQQVEQFKHEGMLCIPDFLSKEQITQLVGSGQRLLAELDLLTHPKTKFKTGENDHIGDQYFFDSSDKVSYFFDVDAFDSEGMLRFAPEKSINKIGHGIHMHCKDFEEVTFSENVQQIARDLHYEDPRVLQSMLIFKNPAGAGSKARDNEVPPHTDGTFLFTKPHSALGFWFALDDCTLENGCLTYYPGTHKKYPISKRFVKIDGGAKGCNFIDVEGVEQTDSSADKEAAENYVLVECKAGSLVLIHGSVLHRSEKNKLQSSRWAYAFHLIEGTASYDELNWLQVPPTGGTEFTKLFE